MLKITWQSSNISCLEQKEVNGAICICNARDYMELISMFTEVYSSIALEKKLDILNTMGIFSQAATFVSGFKQSLIHVYQRAV